MDPLLPRFGTGGLADVHGFPVATELDGHAVLTLEFPAQALPAQVDVAGLELKANRVDQVIGQYRQDFSRYGSVASLCCEVTAQ